MYDVDSTLPVQTPYAVATALIVVWSDTQQELRSSRACSLLYKTWFDARAPKAKLAFSSRRIQPHKTPCSNRHPHLKNLIRDSLISFPFSRMNVRCAFVDSNFLATTAEKERVAFTDKDTPEIAQLKLDLLRIAALTGRYGRERGRRRGSALICYLTVCLPPTSETHTHPPHGVRLLGVGGRFSAGFIVPVGRSKKGLKWGVSSGFRRGGC